VLKISWKEDYSTSYGVTIYKTDSYNRYGTIECEIDEKKIELKNNILTDIFDVEWKIDEKNGEKILPVLGSCFCFFSVCAFARVSRGGFKAAYIFG
jgi:hypothetical protein